MSPTKSTDATSPRPRRGTHDDATALEQTRADEEVLLRRYARTREPALKEELVERLLPLARSMAMRYRGGSEPLDDLVQVASLGLVKAIEGFDPGRGRAFAAYAAPTILGELRRHFRDHVWTVRLPRGLQERTADVRDAESKLGDLLGRSPTVTELAAELRLDEEEVLEALEARDATRTVSLDAPRGVEDEEAQPMIEAVGSQELGYGDVETQLAAEHAQLDQRERTVLELRFGCDLTQAEIGSRLGVSQMQISRIMRRALDKLLTAARGEAPARAA